jgi:hypothetical protein
MEGLFPSESIDHAAALPIVALVAVVCWCTIERPLISFARRRWRYEPVREAASAIEAIAAAP